MTEIPAIPIAWRRDSTLPLKWDTLQEDLNTYNNAVMETIVRNIKLLKELPPPKNFTLNDLVCYFEEKIKNDLEQDILFEETVEVGKYTQSMDTSMDKYFARIYDVNEKEKTKKGEGAFSIARLFLNSNLSDEFFKTVTNSYFVEKDFSDVFERRLRKEQLDLNNARNNRKKFVKLCEEHNTWVQNFSDIVTLIEDTRIKLIWYVELNNSKTIDELFKEKFLFQENLCSVFLAKLVDTLREATNRLEEFVLSNLKKPILPPSNADDAVKTITDLIHLLTV